MQDIGSDKSVCTQDCPRGRVAGGWQGWSNYWKGLNVWETVKLVVADGPSAANCRGTGGRSVTKPWPRLLTATRHHRHGVGPTAAPSGKAGAAVGQKPNCGFCPTLTIRLQCRWAVSNLPLAALLKLLQIYSGGSNKLFHYISFQLLTFPSLATPMRNQTLHLHVYPIQLKHKQPPMYIIGHFCVQLSDWHQAHNRTALIRMQIL